MKPEVWVPSLAALLSPLIPWLFDRLARRRPAEGPVRSRAGRLSPAQWGALIAGAVATALLVRLVPPQWQWPVLVAYLACFALAYVLVARHRARRPHLFPETERFLRQWGGKDGGYPYDRDFLPDLVRVYTKNELVGTGERSDPLASQRPEEARPSLPKSFEDLLTDPQVRHLALTGEAGTGKTSLLQFWRHDLRLRRPTRKDALSRFVPLLIPARYLIGRSAVAEAFGPEGPDVLSRAPGVGMTWLLMIDAFDEITDAETRAAVERIVFEAIEAPAGERVHTKFIVTSRGLTDDRRRSLDSRGVTEYRLRPFTLEQLHQYLVKEETSARAFDGRTSAYDEAVEKVDRFMDRWEGHDELLDLIRLPLLARVTSTIYFQDLRIDIPSRRVDIYYDAIEHWISQFHKRMRGEQDRYAPALHLLREWAEGQGELAEGDDSAVRALLRALAVSYIEVGPESVFPTACELLSVPLLPRDPDRVKALLALLDATGLVHDVKAINPSFIHKSYAEYLAAPALFDHGADLERWDAALSDPDRRIGAVFALAQMEVHRRRELFEALASSGSHPLSCGWVAAEGLCVKGGSGLIDETQRDCLIEVCVQALPPYPSNDWWDLIDSLTAIEAARDALIAVIEARSIADWTLQRAADIVARQDARGVALLQWFAESPCFPHRLRAASASDLVRHEPELGLAILKRMATEPDANGDRRVSALRSMVSHELEASLESLYKLAVDAAVSPETRAFAVATILENTLLAWAELADLAEQYALDRSYPAHLRVHLAYRLAEGSKAQVESDETVNDIGIRLLRSFAEDTSIDDTARETSASRLMEFDRETGAALLLQMSTDRLMSDSARWWAERDLAEDGEHRTASRLLEVMEDGRRDIWTRINAAGMLSRDLPDRSREWLESIAFDTCFTPTERVYAMSHLTAFDRDTWVSRLAAIACQADQTDGAPLQAAASLADDDPTIGLPLLAQIAEDIRVTDSVRLFAIEALIRGGDRSGLERLGRIVEDESAHGSARVGAAKAICGLDPANGAVYLRKLRDDPRLADRDRVAATAGWVESGNTYQSRLLFDMAENQRLDGSARIDAAEARIPYDRRVALEKIRAFAGSPWFTDGDRCRAATILTRHDRKTGADLVRHLARAEHINEDERLSVIRTMIALDPDEGMTLLEAFAVDRTAPESNRPDGAHLLAVHGNPKGIELLRGYARDPELDCRARVDAAVHLLEFDREGALELLHEQGTDADFDIVARVFALDKIVRHDESRGLALLRSVSVGSSASPMSTVLADDSLARYEPEAVDRLIAVALDEDADDWLRVRAAAALASHDRQNGIATLTAFMQDKAFRTSSRIVATDHLIDHHRHPAMEAFRAFTADEALDGSLRVAAAGMLIGASTREGLAVMRGFIANRELDDISRVTAAWALAGWCKREGMRELASIRTDAADGASHCWAEIALSEWDPVLRASLPERYGALPKSELELMRQAAGILFETDPRAGSRALNRVATIAAACR